MVPARRPANPILSRTAAQPATPSTPGRPGGRSGGAESSSCLMASVGNLAEQSVSGGDNCFIEKGLFEGTQAGKTGAPLASPAVPSSQPPWEPT